MDLDFLRSLLIEMDDDDDDDDESAAMFMPILQLA